MTSAVIDSMFSINNAPIADNANGAYFVGNQVMAIFGWVASAKEKPNENKAGGTLRIEGDLAAFTYTGPWAMFRLIETHKISQGTDFSNGIIVQFEVPVASTEDGTEASSSKMVYKITPLLREGDKLVPITWPVFPTSCPDLHQSVKKTKESENTKNKKDIATKKSDKETEKPASSLDVDVSFDDED